jgi:hypothetical protein
MPPLGRTAHYFSRGEYHTALLLLWLGVDDLREQFPLWPAPHPHPLYGSPLQSNAPLTWAKGLLSIAEEAGIAHGVEVGTRVPYIASLDLLATVSMSAACYSKGHTIKHGHAVSNCHDVRVCFSPLASRWTPRCCNIAWHVLRAGDAGRRQRVGPDVGVRTYCG